MVLESPAKSSKSNLLNCTISLLLLLFTFSQSLSLSFIFLKAAVSFQGHSCQQWKTQCYVFLLNKSVRDMSLNSSYFHLENLLNL